MARLEHPLVLVTWHDAHTIDNDEWHELVDLTDEPCVVQSVGWLLSKRNARHLILAQSLTDDKGVDNVLFIPARMVRKVVRLQIPHKRRKVR
jgi:hypothetical protein